MSPPASGYLAALAALSDAGVDCVVVGVGGINFYARTPSHAYMTLDVDVLLAPAPANLQAALAALAALGFAFEAGGEPFVDVADETILGRVVARGVALRAYHAEAGELDLMTSITGFSYPELAADATTFDVDGREVRVGSLEKLLRAKEASGRPKDLEFLRAFEARPADDDDDA